MFKSLAPIKEGRKKWSKKLSILLACNWGLVLMWKLKRRKQKKIWRRWESSLLLVMMLLSTQYLDEEKFDLMRISTEQHFTVSKLRFKRLLTRFSLNQIRSLMKVICSQQKRKNQGLEITRLRSTDQRIKSERSLVNRLERVCLQNMWLPDQITMSLQRIVLENNINFNKLPKCWIYQQIKSIIQVQIHIIRRFFRRKPMERWKNDHNL